MGQYFLMSENFDKCCATQFGLVPFAGPVAMNPQDRTLWVEKELYDFGAGKEYGYYKMPMPDYKALLELVLHNAERDDVYGAAAVILDEFSDDLLCLLEEMIASEEYNDDFKRLVDVFRLSSPINRCRKFGMTPEQCHRMGERWRAVAQAADRFLGDRDRT